MSRKTVITCDGCGTVAGGDFVDQLASGWSTVAISQKWPGIVEKPTKNFDLCFGCSERVLPTTWPRFVEHVK